MYLLPIKHDPIDTFFTNGSFTPHNDEDHGNIVGHAYTWQIMPLTSLLNSHATQTFSKLNSMPSYRQYKPSSTSHLTHTSSPIILIAYTYSTTTYKGHPFNITICIDYELPTLCSIFKTHPPHHILIQNVCTHQMFTAKTKPKNLLN